MKDASGEFLTGWGLEGRNAVAVETIADIGAEAQDLLERSHSTRTTR